MVHSGNQEFDAVGRRSTTNLKTNETLSNSDDFTASSRKREKPDSGLRSKKKRFTDETVPDILESPISESVWKTNHGLPGIFDTAEVQEEVEHKKRTSFDSSSTTSLASAWQLHFVNKLPSTLFTGCRIESADGNSVKIVILNSVSKEVMSSGPLSSLRIEIVVLNGDFGPDYQEEDWTEKEFNANLVREREGRRPLVIGELVITLRDGVGYVDDASFTDNSSWIRSRKFRLGARAVQSKLPEVRIREARSEAFVVKDHRGEAYKKHHPPNLNDEVWRLEKISKGGTYHKALHGKGITTVQEFLRSYSVDPSSLRLVLGGMSNKIWKTVTEHATACVLDDKLYIYYKDGERIGPVFNSIFGVVGATFDGQSYLSLDMLNEFQMGLVENLKRNAYRNLHELVPLDAPPVIGPAMLPSSLLAEPYSSSRSQLQDVNFAVVHPESEEGRGQQTDQSTLSAPCLEGYGCGSSYGIVVSTCCDPASTQPMSNISHPMPTMPHMMPPLAPSQDTSSMTVKAMYGDDIIKFQLPFTSGIIELKEEVAMRLMLELDSFNLKYKDEDGDWILLPCDKDLRNYLQLFNSMVNPVIRLLVVDKVARRTKLWKSF